MAKQNQIWKWHFLDYCPALDGLSSDAGDVPIPPDYRPDDQLIEEVYLDTLNYLDANYKGAIKRYQLDELIKVWKQPIINNGDFWDTSRLFVILDHYHARLSVTNSLKKSRGNNRVWPYFAERINECLQVEANARLKVIAIFRLMPESWIGEDQLKQVILEQIKSAAPVKNPKIDLDLKISRSGKSWMNAKVLSEWKKLKTHLDHHRPQIVTYIVKTNDYSHRTRSAIAYNYQILNSNKVKLKIYQPLADRDQYLTIDLARFYHYVNDKRIAGFYILDYQPKSVPVGWWQNIFKRFFLIQLFWYLKRIFYYLFRWNKPLQAKYWSLK